MTSCEEEFPALVPSEAEPYSYMVSSHVYGSWRNLADKDSIFLPWLAEFPVLNDGKDLRFGVLLGDVLPYSSDRNFEQYKEYTRGLQLKMYYTPGNHDLDWDSTGAYYDRFEREFGPREQAFMVEQDLFVFINSHPGHWNLTSLQLDELQSQLQGSDVRNVFLFTHNILWWDRYDSTYSHPRPNSTFNHHATGHFHNYVLPVLQGSGKPIYFFAGDTGNHCDGLNLTRRQEGNVCLITTGIGCPDESAYLQINVSSSGKVFSYISPLSGSEGMSVNWEDYIY